MIQTSKFKFHFEDWTFIKPINGASVFILSNIWRVYIALETWCYNFWPSYYPTYGSLSSLSESPLPFSCFHLWYLSIKSCRYVVLFALCINLCLSKSLALGLYNIKHIHVNPVSFILFKDKKKKKKVKQYGRPYNKLK